jgi:hypothetical protein
MNSLDAASLGRMKALPITVLLDPTHSPAAAAAAAAAAAVVMQQHQYHQ